MSDVITIQEYNLLDYSLKLQEAVESGYRVGDGVDGCPMIVGFSYCATLTKAPIEVGGLGQAHEAAIDGEPVVISGEGSAVEEVFVVPQKETTLPVEDIEPQTPVESTKPPTKRVKRG